MTTNFKDTTVEAVRFRGSSTELSAIEHWIDGDPMPVKGGMHTCDMTTGEIDTANGVQRIQPGDYVVKHHGLFFLYRPEVYKEVFDDLS